MKHAEALVQAGARLVLEVAAGLRPTEQLLRFATPALFAALQRRGALAEFSGFAAWQVRAVWAQWRPEMQWTPENLGRRGFRKAVPRTLQERTVGVVVVEHDDTVEALIVALDAVQRHGAPRWVMDRIEWLR